MRAEGREGALQEGQGGHHQGQTIFKKNKICKYTDILVTGLRIPPTCFGENMSFLVSFLMSIT